MITLYCVVYRTGGYDNFQWHRSLAMSQTEALKTAQNVEKQGYKAYIANYNHSIAIGLPETFAYWQAAY